MNNDAKLKYGVKYGVKPYFMSTKQLTIGALAKACGVNVESIRYYHRIGQSEDMPVQCHRGNL